MALIFEKRLVCMVDKFRSFPHISKVTSCFLITVLCALEENIRQQCVMLLILIPAAGLALT